MKIILLLLLISTQVHSENVIKIWHSTPMQGMFIPSLNIPTSQIFKPDNDGVDAITEALQEDNSFIVVTNTTVILAKMFNKNYQNPFELMDYVATIGSLPFAVGVSNTNESNTIEELIIHKSTLTIGGSGNINSCMLAGKYIQMKYHVKVNYVFYKSGIQSLADITNNQLDMVCRYGSAIHTDSEVSNKIKLILKFTDSNEGILKNIPIGEVFDNSIVLLTNKKTPVTLREYVIKALYSDSYLREVDKHKVNYIYFNTKIDKIGLEHNNIDLYDKLLTIIHADFFLTKLLRNQ